MTSRIVIAGTHSSVGKTTVTVALLAALRRLGVKVAPFKAGPDYIDPSLHTQAAGVPARNLDTWLLEEPALRAVFARGTRDSDLAVIEGVMGLFDGIGASQEASTAALARTLTCPVVLVLDVRAMSGTAAALALGCQAMRPGVNLVGVILNRVANDRHAQSTADAIRNTTGLPVVGSLPSDERLAVPERHLGLMPATEGGLDAQVVERLADLVEQRFDLAAIRRLADAAPSLPEVLPQSRPPVNAGVRIAVGQDRAFGFYYQDTLDLLADRGAELVPFSPVSDEHLPQDLDGIYLGGGFPELYAAELSANASMREALQRHARAGKPIYAECGGLMALGTTLTTFEGKTLPMFDVLPVASRMQRQALTLGYRNLQVLRDTPLLPVGGTVRGHEFHWSVAEPPTEDLAAYQVIGESRFEGYCIGSVLGSYVHLNLAGRPAIADRFISRCGAAR